MPRRRKHVNFGLPQEALDRVEQLREALRFGSIKPSKAEVLREAVSEGLDAIEERRRAERGSAAA